VKRLGAIIAGGKGSRFGGDKASAMLNGRALIDHVAGGLRAQVDHLIICGRDWPEIETIADRPSPDMGPLGGLNAALHYAADNDFGCVITAGCDVLPVPQIPATSDEGKAVFLENHFLFGQWPASLAEILDRHLEQQDDLSVRHWIAAIGARPFLSAQTHYNLNTQGDLAHYAASLKTAAA
jgi:molybdenum cofactor guanylyltransferase